MTAQSEFLISKGDLLYAAIDTTIYSESALKHTVHRFTNRCFVLLERESEGVRNLILAHALSESALIHPELDTDEPSVFAASSVAHSEDLS